MVKIKVFFIYGNFLKFYEYFDSDFVSLYNVFDFSYIEYFGLRILFICRYYYIDIFVFRE